MLECVLLYIPSFFNYVCLMRTPDHDHDDYIKLK